LQISQETFKLLFYSDSGVQRRRFCEPVRGQKIEEHVTDLDVLSDAITGSKDIGPWSSNIPEKMW